MNTRQIFKNATPNYGRMAVGIVTTLLLTPLILHKLGAEAYGLWTLTLAVAGYFSLVDLGITGAAIRYVTHYRALQDWPNLNKTIGSTLFCYFGMACIALVGSFAVAACAPHLFHVMPGHVNTLRLLVLNIGLVSAIGFATTMPIQCVIAAQRQDALNIWGLGIQVLIALVTAMGVGLGAGVLLLAALQLFSTIANGLIAFVLSRRFLPQARFRPRWDPEQGRLVVSFAGTAALITIGWRVIYYTDTLVIASFLSIAAVAGYAIALKMTDLMRGLVNAGVAVVGTFAGEQAALQNKEALAKLWFEGTKWSLVITLPLCTVFVLTGQQIVSAWIGPGYAAAATALGWLAVGSVFDLAQSSAFYVLMNSGGQKVLAWVTLAEAIINLSLSIILLRHFGIVGVAMGTTFPIVVRGLVFYPWYLSRLTGVSLSRYFGLAVLPAMRSSVPVFFLSIVFQDLNLHTDRRTLVGFLLIGTFLTMMSAYYHCLNGRNRMALKSFITTRLRQRPAGITA